MRRFLRRVRRFPSPLPVIFIIAGTIAVILYGRGYRVDLKSNQIKPTGLLSATSDPQGAQVYINGVLKTATNNPLNIDPNWYDVRIVKEGYIPWEKRLRVQGEVVTRSDAFLFPTSPSLSPLTNSGIEQPTLSPDGTKIAYTIPMQKIPNTGLPANKAGLWIYELVERPLGLNRDPRQLGISEASFNFSTSTITWSPDSTQLLVDNGRTIRLYNAQKGGDWQDMTATTVASLKNVWEDLKLTKELQKLAAYKQEIVDIATSSARIISFSPDESKFLYEATASATLPQVIRPPLIGTNSTAEQRKIEPGKIYVYDSKEDKNYFLLDKKELPTPSTNPSPSTKKVSPFPNQLSINNYQLTIPLRWFPTSRHLVLTLPGKIDIMEYDRTNWVTVYSGPFVDGFIAPWPGGSRIIIMTNLNPGQSTLPNLYTVNLR